MTNNFWQTWKEFEVNHGNTDSKREMLRIKRSVQALYNTQVNMMSAQMLNESISSNPTLDGMTLLDNAASNNGMTGIHKIKLIKYTFLLINYIYIINAVAEKARPKEMINFVRGVTEGGNKGEAKVSNPDEIDLDMENNESDEENNENEDGKFLIL